MVVALLAFFGYQLWWPRSNACEGIFQQTAPKVAANLEALKSKGAVDVDWYRLPGSGAKKIQVPLAIRGRAGQGVLRHGERDLRQQRRLRADGASAGMSAGRSPSCAARVG